MIDVLVKIANVITIGLILCFSTYLWRTTSEMKYHYIGAIIQYFKGNKTQWNWIKKSEYLYIPIVVVSLLVTNYILISQFANETYKVRLDYQFFINIVIWASLMGLYATQHKIKCKLKEKLDQQNTKDETYN